MNTNETNEKTVIKPETVLTSETGYGTNELSVYVSERTGIDVSGKKLRKYLRKIIPSPETGYRNYRFRTLKNSVTDTVIELILTDETKRTERKIRSDENRTKRNERKTEFIDDKFTVDKPETDKPKSKRLKK